MNKKTSKNTGKTILTRFVWQLWIQRPISMDEKEHFLTDLNWTSSNKHNELLKIDSNDYVMGRQEQNYRKKNLHIAYFQMWKQE